jgi:hypothetical protein
MEGTHGTAMSTVISMITNTPTRMESSMLTIILMSTPMTIFTNTNISTTMAQAPVFTTIRTKMKMVLTITLIPVTMQNFITIRTDKVYKRLLKKAC